MVVGFFSDDASGHFAALLTACGLACVGRPLNIVGTDEPPDASRNRAGPPAAGREGTAALRAAVIGGEDTAFAAPLALLRDDAVRACLDVAVVSGGDPVQARRAVRSADAASLASEASASGPYHGLASKRPWLLGFGVAREVRATLPALQHLRAHRTRPIVRRLPISVPLPGRSVAAAMERGLPTLETLRIGIMLAATLEAAAADRDADAIDAAAMAALMSPAAGAAGDVGERMGELADRLEGIERALTAQATSQRPASASCTMPRRGGRTTSEPAPRRWAAAWPKASWA